MPKTALITGITGQDGSHLADFLLNKGYKIIGVKRRSSSFNTERIEHIYNNINPLPFLLLFFTFCLFCLKFENEG